MTRPVESKVTTPRTIAHDTPLYLAGDEALVHILERYPEDLVEINHYGFDAEGQSRLATGTRGRADGGALLAAIKAGKIWVNLRSCERAHPGLWGEILRSFVQLAPQLGLKSASNMTGQLTLSSPASRVPLRSERADVVLFHLRGVKRVWVYPTTEAFMPQTIMEDVAMGRPTQAAPYARIMDGAAWRFDVVPGEALVWPLYAPHRVENQEGLCVSLAVNYETWASRITTGAHLANGVLRRWGRAIRPISATSWPHRAALWVLSVAFSQLGLVKGNASAWEGAFDIPDAAAVLHGEREAA